MAPYLCLLNNSPGSVTHFITRARVNKYSKIAIPLSCAELSHESDIPSTLAQETAGSLRNEVMLTEIDWKQRIIVILPDYDCDASNAEVRKNAETSLNNDLSFGEHLVKTGSMLLQLKSPENTNLARIIAKQQRSTILIQVPMYSPLRSQAKLRQNHPLLNDQHLDTWHWWHEFRCLNNYRQNLKVVLELHPDEIPSSENVSRWLSEPLEAIIVPTELFRYDEDDNPQLSRAWHMAMIFFIRARVNIIITAADDECWIEFADYFYEFQAHFAGNDVFGVDYDQKDELTVPLQTVHSDVNLLLYEEFERDEMKYLLYLNAIFDALTDLTPTERQHETLDVVVLTVLGAGRGPLISCILTAAQKIERRVRIYVIEKNLNAVRTLKYLIAKLWPNEDIHLFCRDMREFTPPEKADILVSELLGSFGDNELSPECLDCAAKFIKSTGISIPCSSTSFLNPIMAPTYRHKIVELLQSQAFDYIDFESTFVTIMRNAYHISQPQQLFTFQHPNLSLQTDNTRYKVLKFEAEMDCVMNGLAGHFEAVLYGSNKLSIHRVKYTPGLVSWFPIFFPFTEPINVNKGEVIEIHFWRCVDSYKVWYEWCCVSPQSTHIHNFKGRSSPIYLEQI